MTHNIMRIRFDKNSNIGLITFKQIFDDHPRSAVYKDNIVVKIF